MALILKPRGLVNFGELTLEHFEQYPVWRHVNEETFRPWLEQLPVDPAERMFLVRATATLADGARFDAWLTPAIEDEGDRQNLGTMQPSLIVPGYLIKSFWNGIQALPSRAERDDFYQDLKRTPEQVFPIRFEAVAGLAKGLTGITVQGFYKHEHQDSGEPLLVCEQ
jgi:hypothetical protein